jgi:hypothetical protein
VLLRYLAGALFRSCVLALSTGHGIDRSSVTPEDFTIYHCIDFIAQLRVPTDIDARKHMRIMVRRTNAQERGRKRWPTAELAEAPCCVVRGPAEL